MTDVEFRVLGVTEVEVAGRRVDLGPPRQRVVLAALLVEASRAVPADHLIYRVWGETPPAAPRRTLSSYISRLRSVLSGAPADIRRQHGGYRIDADPASVDMHRYQRLVRLARSASDDEQAIACWRQAIEIWRGTPFDGLDAPWLEQVASHLTGQHHAALAEYRDLRLRRGEHAGLIPELQSAAAANPLDERLAAQLMLALYRGGRQADALTHYEALRRRLADELGSDPAPASQRLHHQILTADAELAAPVPVSPAPVSTTPAPPGTVSPAPVAPTAARTDPAGAPVTLPWDAREFTGRTPELDRLHDCAATPHRPGTAATVVVSGSGGVGKTALAVHWAHQPRTAERFPDGRLYVNLQGFSEQEPLTGADALRELLRQLKVPGSRIPSGMDSKRKMYRERLDGRRILVILDNATDSEQVRPLLVGAPGLALVTSRNRLAGLAVLEGATELSLGRVPAGEASVLVRRLLGDHHPVAAAARLSAACARLPLALRLAATGFRASHPDTSLDDYIEQLESDRIGILDAGADSSIALSSVLSWSTRRLPAPLALAASAIGLHPGPRVDVPAVAAMLDRTEQQARRVVRELAGASLLEETSPDRWTMHDLLRDHARGSAREAGIDPPAVHDRLLEHYTARLAAQPIDHRWFVSEYPSLMSCMRLPLDTEAAGRYTLSFAGRLLEHAYYADAQRAYEIVRQRFSPDSDAYAQSLYGLGRAGNLLGTPRDRTIPLLTEARRRFAALGDPIGQARSLRELSEVLRKHEQYTYDLDRQALDLYRWAGDAAGEADALSAMGRGAYTLGDYSASLTYGSQAIDAAVRAGSRRMAGRAHRVLAAALKHVGDYAEAGAHYRAALDIAVEISDRGGESLTVAELADFHLVAGQYEEAMEYGRRAIAMAEELADRTSVAIAHYRIAQIHLARKDLAQAATTARLARSAFRDLEHVSGGAACETTEADLLLLDGDPVPAAELYESAAQELSRAGYQRLAAEARYGLGRAAAVLGDHQLAAQHCKQSLETLETIGAAQAATVRSALDWLETGRGSFDPARPLWMAP